MRAFKLQPCGWQSPSTRQIVFLLSSVRGKRHRPRVWRNVPVQRAVWQSFRLSAEIPRMKPLLESVDKFLVNARRVFGSAEIFHFICSNLKEMP